MSKIIQMFNKTTLWPGIPNGPLIAVADAMIEYIRGKPHTFYFILLRAVEETKAVILPFTVTIGAGEGFSGWRSAWKVLPPPVHARIRVLVCDGVQALTTIAKEENWILQRCQFHLRARISHNCSPRRFGKRPQFGQQIQRFVQTILVTRDEEKIQRALYRIVLAKNQIKSDAFRTVISGFLKHYQDYRSYLKHPELHIPTTSNSAEYLIGQIRDLQYRARGFSTLRSLCGWIEAYCKYTKIITCNGKNVPI